MHNQHPAQKAVLKTTLATYIFSDTANFDLRTRSTRRIIMVFNEFDYRNAIGKLRLYDYHYYVESAPLVPDAEYDALFQAVKRYEENSPKNQLS